MKAFACCQGKIFLQAPYNAKLLLWNLREILLNGNTNFTENRNAVLQNLPVGEQVTLVALTKKNGIVYQAREDFTVGKERKLPVHFNEISADGMSKIFGVNVKI